MVYLCPVCGYPDLLYPIEENPICPSCYTEFGFDDEMKTFHELRWDWVRKEMPWSASNVQPPPPNWNPKEQLKKAGLLDYESKSKTKSTVGIVKLNKHFKVIKIPVKGSDLMSSEVTVYTNDYIIGKSGVGTGLARAN